MRNVAEILTRSLFVFAMGLALASVATGDIVEYCSVAADNVNYAEIVETTTGNGPMYGQPFAEGNTLVSNGTGFLAQSTGGEIVMVDGRLQLTIQAEEGFLFDQVNVSTLGSYFGFGADSLAMANSFATVQANGEFYSGGIMIGESGPGARDWQGGYTIAFPATNQASLTLNTQLLAASGLVDASFIEASSIRISVSPFAASVPEPSSVWWVAIALVAFKRRRKR